MCWVWSLTPALKLFTSMFLSFGRLDPLEISWFLHCIFVLNVLWFYKVSQNTIGGLDHLHTMLIHDFSQIPCQNDTIIHLITYLWYHWHLNSWLSRLWPAPVFLLGWFNSICLVLLSALIMWYRSLSLLLLSIRLLLAVNSSLRSLGLRTPTFIFQLQLGEGLPWLQKGIKRNFLLLCLILGAIFFD